MGRECFLRPPGRRRCNYVAERLLISRAAEFTGLPLPQVVLNPPLQGLSGNQRFGSHYHIGSRNQYAVGDLPPGDEEFPYLSKLTLVQRRKPGKRRPPVTVKGRGNAPDSALPGSQFSLLLASRPRTPQDLQQGLSMKRKVRARRACPRRASAPRRRLFQLGPQPAYRSVTLPLQAHLGIGLDSGRGAIELNSIS